MKRPSGWKKILFVLAGIGLALILLEGGTRMLLFATGKDYGMFREYNDWVYRTVTTGSPEGYDIEHPFLPFRGRPGSPGVNSMGYLGAETGWDPEPGVLRIACIGGSTTADGWYPLALEARMNHFLDSLRTPFHRCEVVNLGMHSWTSMESLLNYSLRGVHLKPHILIVYHGINDVVAGFLPEDVSPQPDYSHWRTRWLALPASPWSALPLQWDRFRLVGMIRYGLNRLSLGKVDPHQLGRCGMRYAYEPGMAFTPYDTFRSNLTGILSVARNCGTLVVLVSQFHMTELTVEVFGTDELAVRVAALNEVTRSVARDHAPGGGVFFIDAASGVSVPREWMVDNCHFTPEGYEVLGRYVADSLLVILKGLRWDLPEPLAFR